MTASAFATALAPSRMLPDHAAPAAPDRIVATVPDAALLAPAPIDPAWVREGNPVARASLLCASGDGMAATFQWDCTAGTFDWYFAGDETVHILEGEVFVTDGQMERRLGPGSLALFRGGTWARWHVPVYVRKIAFLREPVPAPVRMAWRGLRLGRRLARAAADAAIPARLIAPVRRLFLLGMRVAGFGLGLVL